MLEAAEASTLHPLILAAFARAGGGMYFAYNREGLSVDIGIAEPTARERADYLEGPIEFALVPVGCVLFLLAHIGGRWACDSPYSIQIDPPQLRALPWVWKNLDAAVFYVNIHVESRGEWRVFHRAASLSAPMLRALHDSVEMQLRTPLSRSEYERIVHEAFAKYPRLSWMVQKAIARELAIPGHSPAI